MKASLLYSAVFAATMLFSILNFSGPLGAADSQRSLAHENAQAADSGGIESLHQYGETD